MNKTKSKIILISVLSVIIIAVSFFLSSILCSIVFSLVINSPSDPLTYSSFLGLVESIISLLISYYTGVCFILLSSKGKKEIVKPVYLIVAATLTVLTIILTVWWLAEYVELILYLISIIPCLIPSFCFLLRGLRYIPDQNSKIKTITECADCGYRGVYTDVCPKCGSKSRLFHYTDTETEEEISLVTEIQNENFADEKAQASVSNKPPSVIQRLSKTFHKEKEYTNCFSNTNDDEE